MNLSKFASRKFLLCLAAFVATFCSGVAGIIPPEWTAIGMAFSAGIYAACEAAVDRSSLQSNTTVNTNTVTATATDKAVVSKVLAGDAQKEQTKPVENPSAQ